ncbi:NRDE family protein [Marilutibacter alkalisoli]|uniref:NRDE family protein n=1 Tax=Marilutibacter alkalisoli TaxID=2591633 RepID=A0A514BR73_9GAMM|nr:NRDE family protein [Lysobacter alkalisoli]QDH69871.1 NRDE family protein [Lysobacter alkalisoli]
MCLIALAWKAHPRYRLALIANRDEFHQRPSAAAGWNPELPDVYGGRDLVQGGGWLMVSTRRRLAAVTNVRAGPAASPAPRSRGALVRGFADSTASTDDWLDALATEAPDHGRFNLLAWDGDTLGFASNHPAFTRATVAPGLHAMSNGAFDASWPKSGHATRALQEWLDTPAAMDRERDDIASLAPLLAALAETTPAPDAELPDTGVGLELERMLSPAFVIGEHYGTRCSTVVLVEDACITFFERRFGPEGVVLGEGSEVIGTTR